MNGLGIAIVCCAIQVTLFALVAAVVYLVARRQGPSHGARTALAGLLGVALLTTVLWSSWPNWLSSASEGPGSDIVAETSDASAEQQLSGRTATTDDSVTNSAGSRLHQPAAAMWSELLRAAWDNMLQTPGGENPVGRVDGGSTWQSVAALVFAIAAAVGIMRLVGGLVGARILRQKSLPLDDAKLNELIDRLRADLGCKQRVALAECSRLATAATIGWRRPFVLLPTTWRAWNQNERRAVLAHELAHVRRGDFFTHTLAQVGVALHFYQPLVHWLAARLRMEQEIAADAQAARVAGGQHSYLMLLAGLALAEPAGRTAWPVRAFLPTRRTFLRRIEMLRDRNVVLGTAGASRVRQTVGWLMIVVLCAAGLVAAGLRAPTAVRAQAPPVETPAVETTVAAPSNVPQYDFSYVPENFLALVAVRPAELAADARLRPLAELLEQNTRPGIPSKLVEQATLLLVAPDMDEQGRIRAGSGGEQIVIHTTEPVDFAPYLKKGYPSLTTVQDDGHEIMVFSPSPSTMSYFAPDKQTLVGRVRTGLLKLLSDKDAGQSPDGAEMWQSEAKGPLLAIARSAVIASLIRRETHPDSWRMKALLMPLLESAEMLLLSVETGENLKIFGRIVCKSPDNARRVAETLEALAVLARNAVDTQRKQLPKDSATAATYEPLWDLIEKCLGGRRITTNGSDVVLEMSVGKTEDALRLIVETLVPAIRSAREAAKQAHSLQQIRMIPIAMHSYAATHRRFPPAVLYGPDGKTPYSWRVALLPYLGQEALHKQYHFDQPWDSPDNRKVLEQMPDVYRHPLDDAGSTNASYFVLTGPDTVFSGDEGTSFQQIRDGTSKTLLAVEAKREIPWTKPEDIPYAADQPLPQLGGWYPNFLIFALCDASSRAVPLDKLDEKVLRAMISKAGGETENLRE